MGPSMRPSLVMFELLLIFIVICNVDHGMGAFFKPRHLKDLLANDRARLAYLQTTRRVGGSSLNNYKTKEEGKKQSQGGFFAPLLSGYQVGSGSYFAKVAVGSPPREYTMIIDTGSDMTWLQCKPCMRCYNQKDALFDPKASSSYRPIPCDSPLCETHACLEARECFVETMYGDGSAVAGTLSIDDVTFSKSAATAHGVILACVHRSEGLFQGTDGLLGLGRGPLSFTSQAVNTIGGLFSYCLVARGQPDAASTLAFGDRATAPPGTIFVPLLDSPSSSPSFYFVAMTGVSVAGALVEDAPASLFRIPPTSKNNTTGIEGGVILDSGTVISWLVKPAYVAVRDAFREKMALEHLKPTTNGIFDTCYDISEVHNFDKFPVPSMAFHFEGGVNVTLPVANYFMLLADDTDNEEQQLMTNDNTNSVAAKGQIACLAMSANYGNFSIIGNIQQQGFRIVFDTQNSRVGFAPDQC